MKELMLHVERIVRPVRATQGRKLKMRRELLAHLEAALEEERGRGLDEVGAIDRAKERLGRAEDLTGELQRSVPVWGRVWFARVPAPRALDRFENRSARWWRVSEPMTMAHASALVFAATAFPYMAFLTVLRVLPPRDYLQFLMDNLATALVYNVVLCAVAIAMSVCAARFIGVMARVDGGRRWGKALAYGAAMMALLELTMFLCVGGMGQREIAADYVIDSLATGAALVGALAVVGRVIAARRRPYDEWLRLEIAE